jgi:hypothetical protein
MQGVSSGASLRGQETGWRQGGLCPSGLGYATPYSAKLRLKVNLGQWTKDLYPTERRHPWFARQPTLIREIMGQRGPRARPTILL